MEATNPKTAQQMFDHLAGIEGGGSLYTLKRPTPFTVEYTEPISRSSKPDPDTWRNRLFVYLSSSGGKKYRIATDCAEDRCAMEHNPEQGWETYSTNLSGFRYRPPSHPDHGESWIYEGVYCSVSIKLVVIL